MLPSAIGKTAVLAFIVPSILCAQDDGEFTPLFPRDGVPKGWVIRAWNDVSQPGPEDAEWIVKDGVLHGSLPRGSWLMWERELADFELKFDFKLGPRGNSGLALRAPMKGDPAFDGLELQMADFRYNEAAKPSELTGGLYRAVAPIEQVYKPEKWNSYHVTLRGNRVQAVLNDRPILDVNLDEQLETVPRHDGTPAPPLKDRPRHGHIGFQELSREGDTVQIRNARIRVLR